jgi:hypothetical protein
LLRTFWKPALIGLAILAAAMAFLYVKSLRSDNARLAEEAARNQAAVARMAEDLRANQRALELRRAESELLAKQRQEAVTSLEKIYETDKEACDWSAGLIPDGVYDRLCQ